jgi:hypothetical protein
MTWIRFTASDDRTIAVLGNAILLIDEVKETYKTDKRKTRLILRDRHTVYIQEDFEEVWALLSMVR